MLQESEIIQRLRDQHKIILGLFVQLEAIDIRSQPQKAALCEQLWKEVLIHSSLEEKVVYPFLESYFTEEGDKRLIRKCLLEHQEFKEAANEVNVLESSHPEFNSQWEDWRDSIKAHIEFEEKEVFPRAQKQLGIQIDALRENFDLEYNRLYDSLGYHETLKRAQYPNGGEQKRVAGF